MRWRRRSTRRGRPGYSWSASGTVSPCEHASRTTRRPTLISTCWSRRSPGPAPRSRWDGTPDVCPPQWQSAVEAAAEQVEHRQLNGLNRYDLFPPGSNPVGADPVAVGEVLLVFSHHSRRHAKKPSQPWVADGVDDLAPLTIAGYEAAPAKTRQVVGDTALTHAELLDQVGDGMGPLKKILHDGQPR